MTATAPATTTGVADEDLPQEVHRVGSPLADASTEATVNDHVTRVGSELQDARA